APPRPVVAPRTGLAGAWGFIGVLVVRSVLAIGSACDSVGPNRSRANFRRANRFGHGLCGSVLGMGTGAALVVVVAFGRQHGWASRATGAGRPRRCLAGGEGPRGRAASGV